MFTC
ncbi:putative acyl-CoA hydrolase, partial [Vibrio parahaemolyticus V-223/04]